MRVNERDSYTGHATTGHEWNDIKELNTRVPKPVWLFLLATFLFAVIYWVLMPAWPLGRTYSKGLLGADVHRDVAASLRDAAAQRSAWTTRLEREDFAAIQADKELMKYVRETGHALFGSDCAVCHGKNATGGPGFPDLVDNAWLWGGTPEAVLETIRVGVNSDHPDSRSSQMPAWGRDQMLDREAILNVVAYVRSLSHPEIASGPDAQKVVAGQKVFATNCSACHGEDANGSKDTGAPDLTDSFWLYGGDEESIYRTVWDGRQGHMPTWEKRLTETDRKILTLYVLDLKQGAP
ncbi:cytochrome-c oxidase, cbb3-type subunit III [Mesorhizobium sp. M2C.T.Ca.TU.002.02.1.1]|uniref:cytochrome-c oxidase, cbb3-type subunit III n=1 Tax=Mesorhizobium sp. M2C.T.Ca.TU.002.02.1.1 TaxID=2496788 RepID=UPI000FCCAB61|nr:cytochrome-c oxidase, cbb3-type subunit III [Mesorhizobium sp. M2C.T.Ca.TU.002.02.1.1]RUU56436.1 cytochrome-c oxidase, cbb3-type subunit III [Mesorhizobium sp. M2C.T.Ca.TU.002.02.1.1]RUU65535.1 cytochrome-c oxidase, cbb3-type subunit III [Mesorhizobium sp. M2C.T.Ca.TU.009.01.2.1]